jgi:hypothetical protein
VFQPVLPLHECDDPAAAESTAEPIYSIAKSATTVSAVEPLQSVADSTDAGAAPTETS